jgi:hypothetical protein
MFTTLGCRVDKPVPAITDFYGLCGITVSTQPCPLHTGQNNFPLPWQPWQSSFLEGEFPQ